MVIGREDGMKSHMMMVLAVGIAVWLPAVAGLHTAQASEGKGGVMGNSPIGFWELASNDADKSVEFFRTVFGWKIDFNEDLGFYHAPIDPSENIFGGGYIFTLKDAQMPFLTLYIVVEDLDAMVERVEEHGGYIVDPPRMIGKSYLCLFNEPSGVTFAMIEARKQEDKKED
jgi:predicted enzyme related to lactoylglutathione lyase